MLEKKESTKDSFGVIDKPMVNNFAAVREVGGFRCGQQGRTPNRSETGSLHPNL
jgi:hypothetical protein